MIVDVHTHVGEYPTHIGEKFAAEARKAWPEVALGGSLDDHHRAALADVDPAIVLAFNALAAGLVVPNHYVAEYVARDRRHASVNADVYALVGRRWLLSNALVAAAEYGVMHKRMLR
jgi:hypothetical protein